MAGIVLMCCLVGAAVVAGTLWMNPQRDAEVRKAVISQQADEEYGKRLIEYTTDYMGPDVSGPMKGQTGNRLACASCHIGAGREPGQLSLATAVERYPRNSPRSGAKETIEERIQGCMTRSMNGRRLPEESREMKAMVAYLKTLAEQDAATSETQRKAHESKAFKTPARKANLDAGRKVFEGRCAACHQTDGQGLQAGADIKEGFVFPPLWGASSFNDGAGMHRVLTAAKFIKAKMPLGSADLNDDEAFDVSAFLNSQPRPHMEHLDLDYPDKKKKPVDAPFPPFADPFSLEQHQYGPFGPIEDFYKQQAAAKAAATKPAK
jgi:thiosulfate dehydrogenase